MSGFTFSLVENSSLRETPDGYFLVSTVPLRILRLNAQLFRLLQHINSGGELSSFVSANPGLKEGPLLRTLLSLVSRGYLSLDRLADIALYPRVSIIIPVKDQPQDLQECLQSLESLDYPRDMLEIIVVDDGSKPPVSDILPQVVTGIRNEKSQGPAACRNAGAEKASGEILAFLDADCIASRSWLRELIPFFGSEKTGAVGGLVSGFYRQKSIDRYEDVSSSLNMGKRLLLEGNSESSFYAPTANILVSREVFQEVGGFEAGRRLGEDVDFCWRMRRLGYTLVYAPLGSVAHKHRNRLGKMLKRRCEYGSSEAELYRTHPEKKKTFLLSLWAGLSFLPLVIAILLPSLYPLALIPMAYIIDLIFKHSKLNKFKDIVSRQQLAYAALRSFVSLYYFAFFHLIRYYLILLAAIGFFYHPMWYLATAAILVTSMTDYIVKKPALFYPVYFVFYLLEHLAYQVGVFMGCLRQRYFGSYLVRFRRV
jgi:mycofactocin system glycosyltransferase